MYWIDFHLKSKLERLLLCHSFDLKLKAGKKFNGMQSNNFSCNNHLQLYTHTMRVQVMHCTHCFDWKQSCKLLYQAKPSNWPSKIKKLAPLIFNFYDYSTFNEISIKISIKRIPANLEVIWIFIITDFLI